MLLFKMLVYYVIFMLFVLFGLCITHVVVEGLGLAAVVAGLPPLGGGAVQVPEHAAKPGSGIIVVCC